jgi:hypothetical protein
MEQKVKKVRRGWGPVDVFSLLLSPSLIVVSQEVKLKVMMEGRGGLLGGPWRACALRMEGCMEGGLHGGGSNNRDHPRKCWR